MRESTNFRPKERNNFNPKERNNFKPKERNNFNPKERNNIKSKVMIFLAFGNLTANATENRVFVITRIHVRTFFIPIT